MRTLVAGARPERHVGRARPRARCHRSYIRAHVQHKGSIHSEGAVQRRLQLIGFFDADAATPETLGELHEICLLRELPHLEGLGLVAAVRRGEGPLVLVQREVVVDEDHCVDAVARRGLELRRVIVEAAITREAQHRSIRKRALRSEAI